MLGPSLINLNLLYHPADRALAIQPFTHSRALFSTSAIRPILVGEEKTPGRDVQTDEQILQYTRSSAGFNWHTVCTWVESCGFEFVPDAATGTSDECCLCAGREDCC